MKTKSQQQFKTTEYKEFATKVSANEQNFSDLRVEDGYVYMKAEHLTGEQAHDEYSWKLWIPRDLVPEVLFQAQNSPLVLPRLVPEVKPQCMWNV